MKQEKTESAVAVASEPEGSNAGAAKQRGEPESQKYKVVWWMVDPTPAQFTEVFKTKAEAQAFALGLREHDYFDKDDIKVRKA